MRKRKADMEIGWNLRHIATDMDVMLDQHGVHRIILAESPEITERRGIGAFLRTRTETALVS
jgi:hypothetical protein